ncbi:hypothetical protein [Maribacter sp. 2304DJ31-5]|uniref:hypothetical protein n=1 Tax=Maribacter sp. 2304DJ31-5 TaxID=3386273 RepID=UPI0039BD60D5
MMKATAFVLLFVLTLLGCTDTDGTKDADILSGTWQVQNISGGFAGIDDDYTSGVITWTFASVTSKLTVVNTNDPTTAIYDGLPTGTYDYAILLVQNEHYLEIDGQEFSGISFLDGQLLLDQNNRSTGSGADGFVLRFNP